MRNLVTKLALVVATAATSFAGMVSANTYGVQMGVGYRQDSLQWRVKDHGEINPNSKSNIHFKDLEIVVLGAKFKGMLGCSLYNRTSFDYGWIVDGNTREEYNVYQRNSYDHCNHNGVIAQGSFEKAVFYNKKTGNSYVWDFNIGFGVPYQCWCNGFQIAPMIGFSYDREQVKTHRSQSGTSDETGLVAVNASNSCGTSANTYRASWWGPYFGFDFSYSTEECWNLFGEFELHVGSAERHRKSLGLGTYFQDYSRSKFFWGPTVKLGMNYVICENWYAEGAIGYTYWVSSDHRDYLRLSSGSVRLDVGYLF